MTEIDMETYEMNPTAIAAAMLERGFGQLLKPDALDDGPVDPPVDHSECSKPLS